MSNDLGMVQVDELKQEFRKWWFNWYKSETKLVAPKIAENRFDAKLEELFDKAYQHFKGEFYTKLDGKINSILDGTLDLEDYAEEVYRKRAKYEDLTGTTFENDM